MADLRLSRRAVLGGGLVAASMWPTPALRAQGLFGFGGGNAAVDPTLRLRAIQVDVSYIVDRGGRGVGERLASVLGPQLAKVFADRLVPGDKAASLLTARMTTIFLAEFQVRSADAFGNNDSIEGDGIVTSGGRVTSTTHVLTELPPSYSGAQYDPTIDSRRFTAIAYQFAYWLRREMGV